ncbi:hypothetical protein DNHGIG_30870 [Collibacillus ludicampi]|uniref:DhaL domain-containing protein n=1 Tax=Collibacillus ludicampi TaxID=2771369 RepID=A0AAV4LIF1_9BACL|nr:DAK2 domain-containing protein [Collibacillus ludicampi]GIM47538.1 hypothetical protein DNHGIG_30870 [Collibacillus ludicampi]
MDQKVLDGTRFVRIVLAAHHSLEANKEHVNALNVFPIPDGDTGTNMSMSFASGVQEMMEYKGTELYKLANSLSTGLLMGARGNSGVILSQLFRGFAHAIASQNEIDVRQFASALQNGVQTAYRAVVKPVEGTILTVAKEAARAAQAAAKKADATIRSVLEVLVAEAERALARTPDQLPILRQAGVVDSGGQGLVYIYKGFLAAMTGEEMEGEIQELIDRFSSDANVRSPSLAPHHGTDEFGYCTEFFIRLENRPLTDESAEQQIRQALSGFGNSLLVVADKQLVKIHIHAMRPGKVLERAMDFGPLSKIKIDNMTEQYHRLHHNVQETVEVHEEEPSEQRAARRYAIVTVAVGEGIVEVFQSLGVTQVIEGGPTMNPSTEDIMKAVEETGAEHVFVLPNNANIIMAAEQAQSVLRERMTVIPSRSIPQGIAAVLAFHEEHSQEENRAMMTEALSRVKSASITQAVRNSHFQEHEIREGDYLGLYEGKVVSIGHEQELTAQELLAKILDEDDELVTVFYGESVKQRDAESLVDKLSSSYKHCEFELQYGGQPLYDFIFSIE